MAKRLNRKAELQLGRVREALAQGRPHEAWAEVVRLLAGRVRDPAVLNLAGVAAYQCGDAEQALDLLGEAARRAPGDAEIHMNLGNVLAGCGDTEAALQAYTAAHELARGYREPAFNAGVLLLKAKHFGEAAAWFLKALERDPDHAAAAIGRAEALHKAGDLAAAEAELRALIARRPEDAVAFTNLAAVLDAKGDDAGALQQSDQAIRLDPGLAAAHFNKGVALQGLGQCTEAIESYRRTLALEPGHAAAALNQGEAYCALGKLEDAERAFKRARDIDPSFAKACVNLADLRLAEGNPAAAVREIDTFLGIVPAHPSALAFKAFALRDLGETDLARALDDPDRYIVSRHIETPTGFAGLSAFNAALGKHVLEHPTLSPSPKAHATRAGRHSGELLSDPLGPMAAFQDQIMTAFKAYKRRFVGEARHPFLDACPDHIRLSVWAVVMESDGHQVPHIHPAAWLSGVYYVDVPDSIRDDDPTHAGWIEFGRPPQDIHAKRQPDVRLIKPEAGLMLLFPSHFYHRTIPLKGAAQRISIAFDVMADLV